MQLSFRRYEPGDADAIPLAREGKMPASVDEMAQAAWSFTALAADDHVVGCAGLIRLDPWRALVWAIFAPNLPLRAWPAIRDKCDLHLKLAEADGIHCIEAEVAVEFLAGHRFVRGLGFKFTGINPGRAANGGLFVRYTRSGAAVQQPPLRVAACLDLTDRCLQAWLVGDERRAA